MEEKIRSGRNRMNWDLELWVGGKRDNEKEVEEMERMKGEEGIKVLMG